MSNEITRKRRRYGYTRPLVQLLETRLVFASDFGDAPLPHPTLLAEGGAEHVAIGPTLGAQRDTEADGVHSPGADGDDTSGVPDDENGVLFGAIRAGQLGATANVRVVGGSARLNAWIDFNGDGAWGGPGEQIARRVPVHPGNNSITFDIPSWAVDGTVYARFRISTGAPLGPGGPAANGEVEDYAITIQPPKAACGCFSGPNDLYDFVALPQKVSAADIDRDGDLDTLFVGSYDDKIGWLENDGGVFLSHTIATLDLPTSVFASDLDMDGDVDVISGSVYGKIVWYENTGNQTFIPHLIVSLPSYLISEIYATDLDGDGDQDFVSALGNKIAWYENDSGGNFVGHDVAAFTNSATDVYASDVDGDGDTDILSTSSQDSHALEWHENDGSQNFTTHLIMSTPNLMRAVYAADMDGDGDTDVLSAGGSTIAWHENEGNQNFVVHPVTNTAWEAFEVYAVDVDVDGDMDLVVAAHATWPSGFIAWYENDGSQSFTPHILNPKPGLTVYAADMEGDGDVDVLSASFYEGILFYENDGSTNFTTHAILLPPNTPKSVYATDMDGDGDTDAVSASYHDSKILWYENDGNQTFTKHTIGASAYRPVSVFAADVDGDGDTDVLSASLYDDEVAWYENDGGENFTAHTISNTANGARSVYAADVDGDGDLDVLSASSVYDYSSYKEYSKIAWYENDGSGNFTSHTITAAPDGARSVFAADVDGDGDIDVLSAGYFLGYYTSADRIAWYENDGSENFTAHYISTTYKESQSVYAADVDSDGDIDILAASSLDDKVTWYENDGNQNFAARTVAAAIDATTVFAADLDGDGDLDVLSNSHVDNRIAWYENDGSQHFTAHNITTTNHASSVYAADMDGDGDLDVLSASKYEYRVAWYENRRFKTIGPQSDEAPDPDITPLPIPPAPSTPNLDRLVQQPDQTPVVVMPTDSHPIKTVDRPPPARRIARLIDSQNADAVFVDAFDSEATLDRRLT